MLNEIKVRGEFINFFSFYFHVQHKLDFEKGYLHVGGRPIALATSDMLTMTVLIPFPFPSTFAMILGIL